MGNWSNTIDGNDTFQDIYIGPSLTYITKEKILMKYLNKFRRILLQCLKTMTTETIVYSD